MVKVTLNVRDANFISFNNNIFTINFNISKFIKFQQLNDTARIYVESVNLIDITDTNLNSKIEGSIDVRCDFIDNQDFSSSDDHNPLLFTNTLYASETIRNDNSMYNLNYKCSTNAFRNGNINLFVKFYNNVGDVLKDNSFIDTNHASYPTYQTDSTAFNIKGTEITNQELVVDTLNTSIISDQTQVDNFESIKLNKGVDVDIARRDFKSEVFLKWGASFASGNNRTLWTDLLTYMDNINNSNIDLYNYYNFPIGEHLRPTGSAAFFVAHFTPFTNAVEVFEKTNDDYLKAFYLLETVKNKTVGGLVNLDGTVSNFTGQIVQAQLLSDLLPRTYSCARAATPTTFFNMELIITALKDQISVVYVSDQSLTRILLTDSINVSRTSLINIKKENSTVDITIPFLTLQPTTFNTVVDLIQPQIYQLQKLVVQQQPLSFVLFNSKAAVTFYQQVELFLAESIKGLSINLNIYDEIETEFKTNSKLIKNNNYTRSKDCYFKRF